MSNGDLKRTNCKKARHMSKQESFTEQKMIVNETHIPGE